MAIQWRMRGSSLDLGLREDVNGNSQLAGEDSNNLRLRLGDGGGNSLSANRGGAWLAAEGKSA